MKPIVDCQRAPLKDDEMMDSHETWAWGDVRILGVQ